MGRRELTLMVLRAHKGAGLRLSRRRLPRQQRPTTVQIDYWKAIQPIVDRVHQGIAQQIVPLLPSMLAEHARATGRMDATPADVSRRFHQLSDDVLGMLKPANLDKLARQFAQRTSDFQRAQLSAQAKAAMGVDMTLLEPELAGGVGAFVADSVRLIRSIPTKYIDDVEETVAGAMRTGERWETLAESIEERYGVTTRRAQLIARDQVGKFYGEVNAARQQAMGVTGYVWRTVRDARVRDEHEEREGEHFEWSDAPEDGHPGEAINCRCYAEPDFSALFDDIAG